MFSSKILMNLFNTKNLARIAAIGGLGVVISGTYFRNNIERNLKNSEYYIESFKILRSNEGIAHYMGAPIRDGKIDLGNDENNYCTGKEAKFEIPVRGSKKSGTFYIFASRKEFSDNWTIDRLELGIEDVPGKRILIVDNQENQD
ncbi:UNVERIFIED_CONTAM: hypothetical protein RMT77_010285 [Armadillidium vulgare]